ncbi:MAG: sulfite exporter TauE/SafE family protein [Rhodocyclaceae bacterium]|nr:sulfite exporter TauE/SafE family protein [Rhodocyclaceae bacterium]
MDFAQTLSGFVVGAIVGLTGVGGGSLMTPLLVLLFGIHPATAVGTDLLYAAITKSGGTWVHARKGSVDWRIVRLLATGSLPAALATLIVVHTFFPGGLGSASKIITVALGVALLLTACALIFRQKLLGWARSHDPDSEHHPWKTIAVGATLGVLVSISSVGAGALGVTALFFLYPKLSAIRIVGSDLAHAVPLTLVAGLGHWWLGSVNWTLLGSLLIGSLPGIYIGSHLASRISERILRPTLAGMLVLVGGKLIAF